MTTSRLSSAGLDRLATHMQQFIDQGSVAGFVLLLHQGERTWIHAAGAQDLASSTPMREDSIFRIASMTKPILATATMLLVEDGRLDLDTPVERWLPELANRQVVRSLTGPLDDTVPAVRPITARHLLTLTWGLGALMVEEGTSPLQQAMAETGISPGSFPPATTPEEWMATLGTLPLAHQPGEGWLYHTGFDVLSVLLHRLTSQPLGDFLHERILEPLGMVDTGFFTPPASIDRLTTAYRHGERGLTVADPGPGGFWSQSPLFPSELVSTAGDFLAFARMLLAEGDTPTGRLLTTTSVREMTHDHIPPHVKAAWPFIPGFWDTAGWGYGLNIRTDSGTPSARPHGWSGGFHTHWQNDPANNLVGLLLAQLEMGSPADSTFVDDFWKLAYEALSP